MALMLASPKNDIFKSVKMTVIENKGHDYVHYIHLLFFHDLSIYNSVAAII